MRGNTEATMLLGRGYVTGIAKKHKISTKISMEAELIRANDSMDQVLWTQYFIKAQGFTIGKSVLLQDNLSTMLLERNDMAPNIKRTKHIRVRYYFIKDIISTGDIVVKYCLTRENFADHFTMPLQGELSQNSRSEIKRITAIMTDEEMCWNAPGLFNMAPETNSTSTSKLSTQECVG